MPFSPPSIGSFRFKKSNCTTLGADWTRGYSSAHLKPMVWYLPSSNVRVAHENEAAGAADAELCHTGAVWAGQVRELGFAA